MLPSYGEGWEWDSGTAWLGGWSIKLSGSGDGGRRPLFDTAVKLAPDSALELRWKGSLQGWKIYARLEDGSVAETQLTASGDSEWQKTVLFLPSGGTVVEVGMQGSGGVNPAPLWIGEIKVRTAKEEPTTAVVGSVVHEKTEKALTWSVYNGDLSLSATTRDFAYFLVYNGAKMLGLAFCCRFNLGGEEGADGWRVQGVTWDGQVRNTESSDS